MLLISLSNSSSVSTTPHLQVFLGKAFKAEDGATAAATVANNVVGGLKLRRVLIVDHPPTAGLLPLIQGLEEAGAEVFLPAITTPTPTAMEPRWPPSAPTWANGR